MPRLIAAIIAISLTASAVAAETLIVFTAAWCGPCKAFKADLAADPSISCGRPVVVMDVDSDRQAARRFKVKSMPTFVLIDGPVEKARHVGYDGPAGLKKWLQQR